ncbi:hypothetical protein PV367_39770 [Streptomyces europaeiscabiei]|uniref:Uncharacterized protein n=1 Tax=Streptomyces europaeiscabiei TaxID=146819 RepID=A0AAJ2PYC8_9ACTN|nr:hypothetical protein [Streptomyces europaeiscabiei]MDX3135802.1 hypothetical protein [Streptomyces europaeiscabiei]
MFEHGDEGDTDFGFDFDFGFGFGFGFGFDRVLDGVEALVESRR